MSGMSFYYDSVITKTKIGILVISLLLGLNYFYFVTTVNHGRVRWFVYAMPIIALISLNLRLTDNFLIPPLVCLVIISIINVFFYVSSKSAAKS